MTARQRLDLALVERGLSPSRARARDAILRGAVTVDGAAIDKPAAMVSSESTISIFDPASGYVSRAALKLVHALDRFAIDPAGLDCLDIGASTGGFTQVLLERGARHVTAIDVGHRQMAEPLRADPRVTLIEGLNARDLASNDLPSPPAMIVCDVSFISLTLALPPALELAAPGAVLVALIKPQFEAGREALGKGGIVRDEAVQRAVCDRVCDWLATDCGWQVQGIADSPIEGGDGNREFLLAARKG
ncbi:MAG: TlyA family RNA methyltransferase [Hyphomicrobiales bacterium]